jgi:hypothetical protein
MKPKQTKIVMNMLEKVPENLTKEDFNIFKLEKTGDKGSVSLHMSISSDNGLLHDNIHVIVNKNGKINLANSNLGSNGIEYTKKYDKVSKIKNGINRFIEDLASWTR